MSNSNPQGGSNPQSGPSSPTGSETPTGDWIEYYDKEAGAYYYFNPKTGEAVWKKPVDESKDEPFTEVEQLKNQVDSYRDELYKVRKELNDANANTSTPIWTIETDDNGNQYYYCTSNGESYYDVPEDGIISISPKQLKSNEDLKTKLESCRVDCNGQYCDKNTNSAPPAPSVSPGKNTNSVPSVPAPAVSPPHIPTESLVKSRLPLANINLFAHNTLAPIQMPVPEERVKNKMTSEQIKLLMNKSSKEKEKLPPIVKGRGGARTRKKRRALVKRTKTRRKFSKRTKSRRKFSNRTRNKK
jgi:hypothetical protein